MRDFLKGRMSFIGFVKLKTKCTINKRKLQFVATQAKYGKGFNGTSYLFSLSMPHLGTHKVSVFSK